MTTFADRRTTEQDVRRTGGAVLIFLVIGGVAVLSEQAGSHASAALLWALACFAAGSLIGFLFGIPRVLQHDSPSVNPPQGSNGSAGSQAQQPSYSIRVNTNLEQISDWLTKIIVGITLVQLQKVPEDIYRASYFIARSLGGPAETFFAGALLIYFSVGGFLTGYLITRLFLTGAFSRADQPSLPLSQSEKDTLAATRPSIQDDETTLTGAVKQIAKRIAQVRLDPLLSTRDITLWAKAQLSEGNAQDAVKGYEMALSRTPDDINLRIDYAIALRKAGMPLDIVKQQLLDAYKRLTPQTDKSTKQRLYNSLTYTLLYMDPPRGFTDVIKFGEEYNADTSNLADGTIDVNLAAAYGQKYSWYRNRPDPGVQLDAVRGQALNAVKSAMRKNASWKGILRMLLDPAYPNKDPQENDLEVFASDQDFRTALGMS